MSRIVRVAEFMGLDPNGRGLYRDLATSPRYLRLFMVDGRHLDISGPREGREDGIEILGSDGLIVRPVVTNCIHVDLEEKP